MGSAERTGFERLLREVIDPGLCTRCGTCVGLCPPNALRFADPLGECLPALADPAACVGCAGPCAIACPGAVVDFPELNQQVYGAPSPDQLLGRVRGLYVGHATDAEVRSRAASGGVITAVLRHLLETGRIAGVACLIDDPAQPLSPRPVIATDWATLQRSQQSKYSLTPVTTVLREIEAFGRPVAFVGLPDQVQSLRMLQQAGHPAMRHVELIVGSFCGAVNHFSSVREFLRKYGIRDLDLVASIEYRAGAWPGRMRVTLTDGRFFELEKFYANYMNLFYVVERSLYCIDLSNEFADFSAGDAWAPRYENRHEGFSLLIARTEAGEAALAACRAAGVIHLQATDRDDAVEMHSHGLFNKKVAVWARIGLRRALGRPVPRYGITPPPRTWRTRLVTTGIALVYLVGQTAPARWALRLLPLAWTGKMFAAVRKRWRQSTRPKRTGALGTALPHHAPEPPGGKPGAP